MRHTNLYLYNFEYVYPTRNVFIKQNHVILPSIWADGQINKGAR